MSWEIEAATQTIQIQWYPPSATLLLKKKLAQYVQIGSLHWMNLLNIYLAPVYEFWESREALEWAWRWEKVKLKKKMPFPSKSASCTWRLFISLPCTRTVVLNQSQLCTLPPRHLAASEDVEVGAVGVTTSGEECYWPLVGRDQGCC